MNPISNNTKINDEMRKQVLKDSLEGIKKFLNFYKDKDNALQYVYEDDPQADLYTEIKKSLKDHENLLDYDGEKWFIGEDYPEKIDKPCLVHCEQWRKYKFNDMGKGCYIDIAVWDPTKDNAKEHYKKKDLLLLIEIKYLFRAKDAIKAVEEDYNKLKELSKKLELKKHQKRLAITFTVANTTSIETEFGKLHSRWTPFNSSWETLGKNGIQALIACRDGIVEVTFK